MSRPSDAFEAEIAARRRRFELHRDHDYSTVDGSAWCDSCSMDIDHPTALQREEQSIRSWGIDWRQRCGFEAGPYRQTERERMVWIIDCLKLERHELRLRLIQVATRLAVLDVHM